MSRSSVYYLPRPTSARNPQHNVYPYLLGKLAVVRSKQAWALDTT
jgi:hypothetical protein